MFLAIREGGEEKRKRGREERVGAPGAASREFSVLFWRKGEEEGGGRGRGRERGESRAGRNFSLARTIAKEGKEKKRREAAATASIHLGGGERGGSK